MAFSLKGIFQEHGIGSIIFAVLIIYVLYIFFKHLNGGNFNEGNSSMPTQYRAGSSGVTSGGASGDYRPSDPNGNEDYLRVQGISTSNPGIPSSCSNPNIQNPSELLPKDNNSQWATLNPSGKGALADIDLLKAGYHIGIDSVGQSLRNANLQIRSEPPNPQLNTGPWNQSTITPDFMRPPLEIGGGAQ